MFLELSRFTLKLSTFLFVILAIFEYLHRGFVSYFFDVRVIFVIILLSLATDIALAKKHKEARI